MPEPEPPGRRPALRGQVGEARQRLQADLSFPIQPWKVGSVRVADGSPRVRKQDPRLSTFSWNGV